VVGYHAGGEDVGEADQIEGWISRVESSLSTLVRLNLELDAARSPTRMAGHAEDEQRVRLLRLG
jgi:hypothetical protein